MPLFLRLSDSHRLLEREVESESGALHQRLDVAEETLGQRERDLTEARERITSLSDELVISQGKVRGGGGRGREQANSSDHRHTHTQLCMHVVCY